MISITAKRRVRMAPMAPTTRLMTRYSNSMATYIFRTKGEKMLMIPPKKRHRRNSSGKNCLMVAGDPNFLFTSGL